MARTLACGVAALWLAAAAVPVARAADDMPLEIVVRPGDTLIGLSNTVLVRPDAWRTVARLNRLPDPNRIVPGQVLRVPPSLLRSRPVPARVLSVVGDVRADGAPLAQGSDLAEGARLATAADASAVLGLADGTRLRMPPASDGQLATSRVYGAAEASTVGGWFAGVFRLVQGSVELLAGKVRRAKPLEVNTPAAVAGVRGTDFRVHHDAPSNLTRTEVIEGTVRLEAASRAAAAADLGAGFGGLVDATGAAPTPQALLGPPDLAGVPALFDRPLVRFAFDPKLGPVQVQAAADPAFDRIVADQRIAAGGEVRLAGLADAAWHLRVRRLDAQGLAGQDAIGGFVLKARPEPPASTRPRAGGKLSVGPVEFGWAPNVDAATARLQVARDAAFGDLLIDREGLAGAEQREEIAAAGTYFWRLASTRGDGDRGPYGDAQRFELRPLPTPPEGGVSADGRAIVLRWSGRDEDRQDVELARDPEFAQIVATARLEQPEWTVPAPSEPGRYYFRYRSVEADGFVSPYSGTLAVDVPRDWRYLWLLLLPLLFGL